MSREPVIPSQYETVRKEFLEDLNAEGILLRHRKSGARVALVPCEDDNKVFYIAFRTTPEDSTGVAHIVEHTVLSGSEHFPVKDPFVEVLKGSLNTFLNAMTYPDKTVYPVASCNSTDFRNLMHIYLDAVFYPRLYKEERIFRQEGWHYEFDRSEHPEMNGGRGELVVNGVVYNEMKGALSSPDAILQDAVSASLFPHTTYAVESGGDPDVIPELTYENYLDFHRKYYHPSNSYIFLYGNCDMEQELRFIDEEYLSAFDRSEVDSEVEYEPAFGTPAAGRISYPVIEEEDMEEGTQLSYNVALPDNRDEKRNLTFKIIDYCLGDAQGAPLKNAILEAGIGRDVESLFECGILQPSWSVTARFAKPGLRERFEETVEHSLREIADNGFEREALEAAINHYEFRYREADFGSYPKGLIYGLSMMDTWLYDDDSPWQSLKDGVLFGELKKEIGTGYYEDFVRKYLLENPHRSIVELVPEMGLAEKREQERRQKLQEFASSLTEEELDRIADSEQSLRSWQDTPDRQEDILKIPQLSRQDLKRETADFALRVGKLDPEEQGGTEFIHHPVFTNGINYLNLEFNIRDIPERLLPALGLLKAVFASLGTKEHTYAQLDNRIQRLTGGMEASVLSYGNVSNGKQYRLFFEVSLKVLQGNLEDAEDILREVLTETDYRDEEAVRRVLEEERAAMQSDLPSSGHSTAILRCESYFSEAAAVMERVSGIGFYRELSDCCEHFEERKEEIFGILRETAAFIFRPERLAAVDTTCAEGDAAAVVPIMVRLKNILKSSEEEVPALHEEPYRLKLTARNEGFITAGQVQYVCRAGNFVKKGFEYTGALRVLKVLMGYDYLWNRIRVKGGAYGCMSGFGIGGTSYFVSYRDPHLGSTIRTFEEAADYIGSFEADERTMSQYIIGAVAALDHPMTPAALGRFSLAGYMSGDSKERMQQERDQVLDCTPEDIRALAPCLRALLGDGYLCVVGSSEKITREAGRFGHTEKLL